MISLRLPSEIERRLAALARTEGKTKSDIIKASILEYLDGHPAGQTPYDLGKDLFGRHSSGQSDRSENRKTYGLARSREKHAKRRSR